MSQLTEETSRSFVDLNSSTMAFTFITVALAATFMTGLSGERIDIGSRAVLLFVLLVETAVTVSVDHSKNAYSAKKQRIKFVAVVLAGMFTAILVSMIAIWMPPRYPNRAE